MPDHVHLVLTPLSDEYGPYSVSEIMQSLKSESAHLINRALARTGRVWQDESFDHVLRSNESVENAIEYLMQNPISAGLAKDPFEYRWFWREASEAVAVP
jgi:REP element-mobilizing transposase RayT